MKILFHHEEHEGHEDFKFFFNFVVLVPFVVPKIIFCL